MTFEQKLIARRRGQQGPQAPPAAARPSTLQLQLADALARDLQLQRSMLRETAALGDTDHALGREGQRPPAREAHEAAAGERAEA
eukprot:CAMPEP_0184212398 /NCGR_PEP_ID=MMETSP0976-20121227/13618_1 /TAXON_ID=483370 /ORGANISM="non described non described, Strain CCMP2097" /LENGTH=84 /DNA_ID=CAMNT_0026517119 /DNA_START=241 /DNA_END=492 /DNA_ORIENTATION=+